jgi:hypothetical protein
VDLKVLMYRPKRVRELLDSVVHTNKELETTEHNVKFRVVEETEGDIFLHLHQEED